VSCPPDATEKTESELLVRFATASSPPSELNATDVGFPPVANGDPDTCVNAPPDATEKTETELAP
jgi:hypothetical protein